MAPGILSSTLQALRSLEQKLAEVHPLSEAHMTQTWPERCKKIFRMSLIGAAVGGIELCYSAETAFVTPLLLQLGVPVYLMTLCWMASPVLGFFLVPVLGSASDTCGSSLGRRRPFIILYSSGIILGLLLVPYGKNIGQLFGDDNDWNETAAIVLNSTSLNSTYYELLTSDSLENNKHIVGIIFTILGVVLLDFCCDGCQTPCRTLMIDLSSVGDQSQGLAIFTVIAGLGGAIGYAVGGVKWSKHRLQFPLDPQFSTHVQVVFGVVLFIFIIGSLLTIFSVQEKPIGREHQLHKYRRMYNFEDTSPSPVQHMEASKPSASASALKSSESAESLLRSTFALAPNEINETRKLSRSKSADAECKDLSPTVESEACSASTTTDDFKSFSSTIYSADDEKYTFNLLEGEMQLEEAGMKVFLKSIIFMPKHMWVLCLCNLFCWMSLVTYSLYFTNYVGQAIYKGVPDSLPESNERRIYDDGVRMGSLAMVLYSLTCTLYSLAIVKLIDRFGTKTVYVLGQLTYSIGMTILAATGHIVTAFIGSFSAGFMYATLFTIPYILVARYHCNTEFSKLHTSGHALLRGLGTDIAIVSSMVFAGQFILSLFIGALIHAAGSTVVIPITAAVFSLCGAITALKVEYVES